MSNILRRCICSFAGCCLLFSVFAQKDRFAYAVTGTQRQSTEWSTIRRFDLQTGTYTDFSFDGKNKSAPVYDAVSKKPYTSAHNQKSEPSEAQPFGNGVAAMAYDKAHHRLYFTPIMQGQLRYLDLRTQKLYYLTDQPLINFGNKYPTPGKVVSRMVIAPDGFGYAVTNDGEQMMRFSTGRNPKITQLGALTDAPENGPYSIHSPCTGYGGDMVADNEGNFLIITARNLVFKVSPANRLARYIGAISGLPQNFGTNGVAVDDGGQLLVSSGDNESDYYRVDPQTLKAAPLKATGAFRTSDLANSNYLQTGQQTLAFTSIEMPAEKAARSIQVFPNPATSGNITLQFHKIAPGSYTIDLTDVLGRSVQARQVTVAFEGQTQTLNLPQAKGVYLVRVSDRNRKLAHAEKVVVQ